MLKIALIALALLCAHGVLAANLSAREARVAAAVDADQGRNVALLEKLVNINSGTFNLAGVSRVAAELETEFKTLGFTTRLVNEDVVNRAPSLLATHRGGRGKHVLLLGHMDTVFEPSSPFQRMTREGDRAAGPGVNDMKGGLVVIMGALRALKQADALAGVNVTVFLTGDEEAAGEPILESRKDLIETAKKADAALSFEGLVIVDGKQYASIARRGSAQWTLEVSATAAHSGGIFSPATGDGAGFELARILSRFHDTLREPNMTYSVGLLLAGSQIKVAEDGQASVFGKDNIVPPQGYARGDLRVLYPEQLERVHGKMRAIAADNLPGTHAKISFEDTYPPMAPTPGNAAILATLNEVNARLGAPHLGALDPMKRGAGDASFIAPFVDVLDGVGMPGEGSHTPSETTDLSFLPLQCKRAALLIMALSQQHPRH